MPDLSSVQSDAALGSLRSALFLTRIGLVAERLFRAFWPVTSVVLAVLAALMLGIQDSLAVEMVGGIAVLSVLGAGAALVWGVRRFRWPTASEAMARLDETLPGRPIQALIDSQAIGMDDPASAAVWRAHQARMAERAAKAEPAKPDLSLTRRDPYALRYAALLAFAVALLFGSVLRVGSVAEMTSGDGNLAGGPTWEGWIEPPRYTGLPTVYLNDMRGSELEIPEGSRVTVRLYGEVGVLTLAETVSVRVGKLPPASDPAQDFTVAQSGTLSIDGPGGQSWQVSMLDDLPPYVAVSGPPEAEAYGQMTLPFETSDDYGAAAGQATIALDLGAVDRRFGLTMDPEPREAIDVPLPMPISGDRNAFEETLIEDFSKHPFANLPVTLSLSVEDDLGQVTEAELYTAVLPGRRFFDPLAAAVIEQRRDILWNRENAARTAQVLRAISHRPDDIFRSETAYLRLRVILRRVEDMAPYGLSNDQVIEITDALWDLALLLEEGDLNDALERLRRAQERLSEAMRNGASDQEIAELMQELRQATDDYIRQLSRQAQEQADQDGNRNLAQDQNAIQMGQDDLQRMMDRIQELMKQGRMAEAQEALQQLQQMMENMRITQGQSQGGQSEGHRAMEGLAETLREQQGLSDRAFRDLQEQFNPGANQGQSQQNEGRNGGQGQGQQHEQGGQGQQGQQQGQGQAQGNQSGQGDSESGDLKGSLADRQQALRNELHRQQQGLPGAGTPEGQAARDALDRAGRAMDGAEEALRQDDYAGAIDQQSEAMDALREGMRALGEQLAQDQQGQAALDGDRQARGRDPLGRDQGSNGSLGTDENLLQGDDVYRRARDLLDEIRRRSGDRERPEFERDYLKRLLDRF